MKEAKKIGLALGGGGAKGSYQIGIIRALQEANLFNDIAFVSGTSIGAINALLVMANLTYKEMYDIWMTIDNEKIYGSGFSRFKNDKRGLYSLNTMYNILRKKVKTNQIKHSAITGFACAALVEKEDIMLPQLRTGHMRQRVFHLNTFRSPHKAVLASASIPVLFGPTTLYGKTYVDGGMLNNYSIEPLIDQACDLIISIPIDGFYDYKHHQQHDIQFIDFGSKKMFHGLFVFDLIDAVRFNQKRINHRYLYGYEVGKEMIKQLEKSGLIVGNKWMISDDTKYVKIDSKVEKKLIKMFNEKEQSNAKDV